MNDERSLERAARSWLEDGPTQAPDRAVEAALLRIETTSQERDLRVPWRVSTMSAPARLAAAAVIAIVVVGGGVYALGSQPSGVGGPTSSPPSATPEPTPVPTPEPTPIPTEDPAAAFATFRAARDAVCLAGSTAKIPLALRYEWIYAETATEPQRADGIAALAELVVLVRSVADQLEAITAPSDIQTEHIANVTRYRALATILERSLELLNAGNFADAKVVDETTNPIAGEFGKWENLYTFTSCP